MWFQRKNIRLKSNQYKKNQGEKSISYSYATLNLSKAMKKPEPIYLNEYGHIRVEIIRLKGSPSIENILAKRYSIEVRADGKLLTAQTNGSYILPRKDKVDVDVTIKNYGKTDFEIKSVIVGKELTKNNSTYESLEFMAGQQLPSAQRLTLKTISS